MAIGVEQANKFVSMAFAPLADLRTDEDVIAFVEGLGWTLPFAPSAFTDIQSSALQLLNVLADLRAAGRRNDHDTVAIKATEIIGALAATIASIEALPASLAAELPSSYLAETQIDGRIETQIDRVIAKRLLDRIVCDALAVVAPTVRAILFVLGIVDETLEDALPQSHRPEFNLREIRLDRLALLVNDQDELLRQTYGWSTPRIDRARLFAAVQTLSAAFFVQPVTTRPTAPFLQAVFPGAQIPPEGLGPILAIPLVRGFGQVPLRLGVIPGPPPAIASEAQSLALRIIGAPQLSLQAPLSSTLDLSLSSDLNFDTGIGVLLRPKADPQVVADVEGLGSAPVAGEAVVEVRRKEAQFSFPVFDFGNRSDLRIKTFFARVSLNVGPADLAVEAGFEGGVLNVSLADADGFLGSVMPGNTLTAKFDLGIGWSTRRGLFLTGSGRLEVLLQLNIAVGPVMLKAVRLAIAADGDKLTAQAGLSAAVAIGPVTAAIEDVGVTTRLRFANGNVGPADLDASFLAPSGIGISVDAGAVHGGGFLTFDPAAGRYSGALQLSVYDIAVSAFGLVETKIPGGGFSFVIVISAEFTPIQLGFGFTLNGVGGLVGINRTVDANALGNLVRAGASEELLFPRNVIANAPAIIRDLGAVFPARQGRYVFGPLGKLGWGTPTLIQGEIGVILELPGPVITLLGEVKCLLPKPETPLVKLNVSVGGQIDFPHKSFALDATLHDSVVNGYPVSGQMAMRLRWGDQPNFALSVGGFHPAFQPPPDFPRLQPLTVDLGQHGAATITVSGFFAVTPNTLQIGGEARLHAGGGGISLDASVGVKALFVFSPFSFEARIDASVRISFHGHGPSVHLSGLLSGPSPWHVRGEVCVSILFWDACLSFNETFGGDEQAPEAVLDPWEGDPAPATGAPIIGLKAALQDPGNWVGVAPVGAQRVVSLVAGAETLVDPLGGLSVRQKAVPVETQQPITRFGVARANAPVTFGNVQPALVGPGGTTVPLQTTQAISDFFAPAQYFDLNEGRKLSAPGFESYQAGYVFAENANNLRAGSNATKVMEYRTLTIAADGTTTEVARFHPAPAQVSGVNRRSAVALGGVTQAGTRRYIDRLLGALFAINPARFVLASTSLLTLLPAAPAAGTRTDTLFALDRLIAQNPEQRLQVQAVALHELAA